MGNWRVRAQDSNFPSLDSIGTNVADLTADGLLSGYCYRASVFVFSNSIFGNQKLNVGLESIAGNAQPDVQMFSSVQGWSADSLVTTTFLIVVEVWTNVQPHGHAQTRQKQRDLLVYGDHVPEVWHWFPTTSAYYEACADVLFRPHP